MVITIFLWCLRCTEFIATLLCKTCSRMLSSVFPLSSLQMSLGLLSPLIVEGGTLETPSVSTMCGPLHDF